jgi:hypothetical protein
VELRRWLLAIECAIKEKKKISKILEWVVEELLRIIKNSRVVIFFNSKLQSRRSNPRPIHPYDFPVNLIW